MIPDGKTCEAWFPQKALLHHVRNGGFGEHGRFSAAASDSGNAGWTVSHSLDGIPIRNIGGRRLRSHKLKGAIMLDRVRFDRLNA